MIHIFAKIKDKSYNSNMRNIYQKAIKAIPNFFDSSSQFDSSGAGIFEPIRQIVNFDEGYIFFLNPDSISLKYIYGLHREIPIDTVFTLDSKTKNELFNQGNISLKNSHNLVKLLNLQVNKSFLLIKLIIKDSLFGFLLLCKKEDNYYSADAFEISRALGAIIAYNIKDVELSQVFKIQLNALQENVLKTKHAYKIMQEQNIKILEADKIKSEFLANVSHELRTPLNSIIGFSEILANPRLGELNQKQSEYVKEIHIAGIHLMGMINEILDLSKIEANAMSINKTAFEISRALDEVINTLTPLARKKQISIQCKLNKNGIIQADFQKIKQILYNLLSNAIKFSPEKEVIEVSTDIKGKKLSIAVKDNGIGIEPKDQEKIFEKFVQLENAYTKTESSTGLGLTITKELVKMHGGTIKLESKIGKGAKFTVTIPV